MEITIFMKCLKVMFIIKKLPGEMFIDFLNILKGFGSGTNLLVRLNFMYFQIK